jgi:hypothetical protein
MDDFVADLKKKSTIEIKDENLSKVVIDTGTQGGPPGLAGTPPGGMSSPMGAPGAVPGTPAAPPPGTPAPRPVPQGRP